MTHPFLSPTMVSQTPQAHTRQQPTFSAMPAPNPDPGITTPPMDEQTHLHNNDQTPRIYTMDIPPSQMHNPSPSPPKVKHTRGPTRYEKEQIALGAASKGNGRARSSKGGKGTTGAGGREKAVRASSARQDSAGERKVLGEWRLGRVIGKGASGQVKIARNMRTGQYAAVKIISRTTSLANSGKYAKLSLQEWHKKMEKARLTLEREIVIMRLIQHPNVMGLYEVFEFDGVLFLVLEHIAGGELFDYLVNSENKLHASEASHYFQQIIRGLDYCHSFNIYHRDLKPENILLDEHRNVKIADFGMAAMESHDRKLETSCGSPHYASPEIVSGSAYHGNSSDIWSCGVVLYALLCGTLPFDDPDVHVLLQKVRRGTYHMPSFVPDDAVDLIRRMLVVKPEGRIKMNEIMQHPFFFRKFDTGHPLLPIVNPPQLEDLAHPIDARIGIEPEILTNLIALCQGRQPDEIINNLTCEMKTIEKAFYWLLIKNREKKLENYESEMAAEDLFRAERANKRAAKAAKLLGMTDAAVSAIQGSSITHSEGSVIRQASAVPSKLPVATRTAPRSPGRPVGGPRANAPGLAKLSPVLPATPQTPSLDRASRISGPRSPKSPKPVKKDIASPIMTSDALLRGIISFPTPSAKPSTHSQQGSTTANGGRKTVMGPPSSIRQVPPPPVRQRTLGLGLGISLEEDSSRIASASQVSQGQEPDHFEILTDAVAPNDRSHARSPQLDDPMSPDQRALRFADPLETKLFVPKRNPSPSFGSTNSPQSSSGGPRSSGENIENIVPVDLPAAVEPVQKFRVPWLSSRTTLGDASAAQNTGFMSNERRLSIKLGRQKSEAKKARPMSMVSTGKTPPTTFDATMSPPLPQTTRRSGRVPAPLDLSIISAVEAAPLSAPPMSSPLLPYQETEGHGGWFGTRLFNWAPATCTYISYNDCDSTREECSRLLSSFGATVILQDSEDTKMLKCNLENMRDVRGVTLNKPVRFRVEVYPYSVVQGRSIIGDELGAGLVPKAVVHSTSLTLTQERGAHTTFKAVHARLREEWRLDSQLRTPALGTDGFPLPLH